MSEKKDANTNTPTPNPAKLVQTPRIPTKETRDDGNKTIINTPRGNKK